MRGGHRQVVQHVVKQLAGAINLGEQLKDIGTKLISLQSKHLSFWMLLLLLISITAPLGLGLSVETTSRARREEPGGSCCSASTP